MEKCGKTIGRRDVMGTNADSDPNAVDGGLWTPLMHAIEDGDTERFERLLAAGADVNYMGTEAECSPIRTAAECGREDMFLRLVELGAVLEREEYCCPVCGMWHGFNKATLFEAAMGNGCKRICRYLHLMGTKADDKPRGSDEALVAAAKRLGQTAMLKELGMLRSVRRVPHWDDLLSAEAMRKVVDVHATHDSGYWPVAVRLPGESIRWRFTKSDGTTGNVNIYTAKAYFAIRVWEEATKRLAARGIGPEGRIEWRSMSPSFRGVFAIQPGAWDEWWLALHDFGNAMVHGGELQQVAESGDVSVRLGRHKRGIHPSRPGETVEDWVVSDKQLAAYRRDYQLAPPGEAHGKPLVFPWKEIRGAYVRLSEPEVSFLHGKETGNATETDKLLFEACGRLDASGVERLLEEGANPNATEEYGQTAFMHAIDAIEGQRFFGTEAQKGTLDQRAGSLFGTLVAHGADPDVSGYCMGTALHEAGHGDPDSMRLLLDAGADPNAASWFALDEEFATPLGHVFEDYGIPDSPEEEAMYERMIRMLRRAGGMRHGVWQLEFKPDLDGMADGDPPGSPEEKFPEGMAERDRKLVQAARRGWEYNTRLAVRWGGDVAARDERGRSLVRIFLEDYPLYARDEEKATQYFMADFMLFLLRGLGVPVDADEMESIEESCRKRGWTECLEELELLRGAKDSNGGCQKPPVRSPGSKESQARAILENI